jgi:two-component system sensor histidine kinase BaeS
MNVRRKLFTAFTLFILGMWLSFVLLTQFIVRDIMDYRFVANRSKELESLSIIFTDYYNKHGQSFAGVETIYIDNEELKLRSDASILLTSTDKQNLLFKGEEKEDVVRRLGVRGNVQVKGETIAFIHYYDADVGNISIVREGIRSSVNIMLLSGAFIFMIISLFIAYWLSKRLTRPITLLTSAIDRLGKGEYGVQASINTKDEYSIVSKAFNEMSNQLQRAEEARRNLVADVAHELRTPIAIIRGKLDLLQLEGRTIEPEALLPLQDELIRLTRLVEDLHQLSLAEAKKIVLEKKNTDLAELLGRIIERVNLDAENKNIKISLDILIENPVAFVDPIRITQVFLNLFINAIRYTPDGGSVKVSIEDELPQEEENPMLIISVSDNGTGIEPEHLPYIFNRFYRTDAARNRNKGGMGLGLAIAKEFVLAHNGTIDVDSEIGYGTTFTVRLPISLIYKKII